VIAYNGVIAGGLARRGGPHERDDAESGSGEVRAHRARAGVAGAPVGWRTERRDDCTGRAFIGLIVVGIITLIRGLIGK
jgi:hypothetical protein